MADGAHRLGRDGRQIGQVRSWLVPVHLLQSEHVRVEPANRVPEPVQVHNSVGGCSTVQDVEGGEPHDKKVLKMSEDDPRPDAGAAGSDLRAALRAVASCLKAEEIRFALAGGYALWVHGAREPVHDVDFVIAETGVEGAAGALSSAGLLVERPPEDWLFKVYRDDAMVDVLHRLGGVPVDDGLLAEATEHEVLGLRIPVLPATPIVAAKIRALTEHHCDFEGLLAVVRAVREQLQWEVLAELAVEQPFAEAFMLLVRRLGIADEPARSSREADPRR